MEGTFIWKKDFQLPVQFTKLFAAGLWTATLSNLFPVSVLTVYLTHVSLLLPHSHNRPGGRAGGSSTFWRLTLLMKPGWAAGPQGFLWQSHLCATLLESWANRVLMLVTKISAGSALNKPRAKPLLMRNDPFSYYFPEMELIKMHLRSFPQTDLYLMKSNQINLKCVFAFVLNSKSRNMIIFHRRLQC